MHELNLSGLILFDGQFLLFVTDHLFMINILHPFHLSVPFMSSALKLGLPIAYTKIKFFFDLLHYAIILLLILLTDLKRLLKLTKT